MPSKPFYLGLAENLLRPLFTAVLISCMFILQVEGAKIDAIASDIFSKPIYRPH